MNLALLTHQLRPRTMAFTTIMIAFKISNQCECEVQKHQIRNEIQ